MVGGFYWELICSNSGWGCQCISVNELSGGSLAMRSKRVCVAILGDVLMLLGKIILLSHLINVWVRSNCF